eukprot:TRINITY_DN27239_c0_g3_i3.p2 TRINITY_DN27239_c0_g3~~TRINITY_DN27239_c0_g3_i3.p2  ORF type:complete len:348 (+),score=64.44 TRINITY_DN27239_c0_g3_i3:116-1159(+)
MNLAAKDCQWDAFDLGVLRSRRSEGLLHQLFTCRTEGLSGNLTADATPSYLSGLLIGHEIREAMASNSTPQHVTVIGNGALIDRYRRAFLLGCGVQVQHVDGAEAVAQGLWNIWKAVRVKEANKNLVERFKEAAAECPIVAILRGLVPADAKGTGKALMDAGVRILEVPMNSPNALESIKIIADIAPEGVIVGAGTVLTPEQVDEVAKAGGKLIVSPNVDEAVVRRSKALGLFSLPGCNTPSEAFAALKYGADGVKAFPGEHLTPKILKAWRAVLPKEALLTPTGGITVDNMKEYWDAGVNGFGIGSNIFKPGDAPSAVGAKAVDFVRAASCLPKREAAAAKRQKLS